MRHNFKTEFLVCLDLSQDVNYVVGRSPSMEGARELTRLAKSLFPDDKVYITKEMVLQQPLKQLTAGVKTRVVAANPETESKTTKCKCGKKAGQCVGSLACQCNPIAMCKKADKWESNPVDDDEDDMSDFDPEEDFEYEDEDEYEDDDGDEDDGYVTNPEEEIEEEEFEEDYRDNPDEEYDDEDEDEDEDLDDDLDEDEDEDEDDDEDEN